MYGRFAGQVGCSFHCSHAISCACHTTDLVGWSDGVLRHPNLVYDNRFAKSQKGVWLIATGSAMGLTFLAKETSIVLLGSIFTFLAISPEIRVR